MSANYQNGARIGSVESEPAPKSRNADVVCGVFDRVAHVLSLDGSAEPSNYMAMVEHMEEAGDVSKRCWKCKGDGFIVPDKREHDRNEAKIKELTTAQDRIRWERAQLLNDKVSESHETVMSLTRECDELSGKIHSLRFKIQSSTVCPECDGIGCLESHRGRHPVEWFVSTQCYHCRGSGSFPEKNLEFRNPGQLQDLCEICGAEGPWSEDEPWRGQGFTVPITARPTGGHAGGYRWSGGSATDSAEVVPLATHDQEQSAVEFGKALRLVSAIKADDAALGAAVEAYCGPDGQKWAGHGYGRVFALWPLTRAGRALIEQAKWEFKLPVCERIAVERTNEAKSQDPTGKRRALIRQADEQARMMRRAVEAKLSELQL